MTNKEILTEHNARLVAIKKKVDKSSPTLSVLFLTDLPISGSYCVDDGEEIYFESLHSLYIEGLNEESSVVIYIPRPFYSPEQDMDIEITDAWDKSSGCACDYDDDEEFFALNIYVEDKHACVAFELEYDEYGM